MLLHNTDADTKVASGDLFARVIPGATPTWAKEPDFHFRRGLTLFAPVWRRKPKTSVIIQSDQGSQYGTDDWRRFCVRHSLMPSMSRRGNCYENDVVESLFSSLKKERIRKQIYKTRDVARAEVFDYIEIFYNQRRRHSHLGDVSPAAFEQARSGG